MPGILHRLVLQLYEMLNIRDIMLILSFCLINSSKQSYIVQSAISSCHFWFFRLFKNILLSWIGANDFIRRLGVCSYFKRKKNICVVAYMCRSVVAYIWRSEEKSMKESHPWRLCLISDRLTMIRSLAKTCKLWLKQKVK